MPNAYALRDTARALLAFMRAGAALESDGRATPAIVRPTDEVKRLCARLAATNPECITVHDAAEPVFNVLRLEVDNVSLTIHHAAPTCFRHRDGVKGTHHGEVIAGRDLVQLAAGEEPDLARARAAHVPANGIPVDGEERVA